MAKTIVMSFDGTWNVPDMNLEDGDTNTNVYRLHDAVVASETPWGTIKRYYSGVGTDGGHWYLVAGATGLGLSDILLRAYRDLIDLWEAGDRLFLFGFSRGAYTARSLSGLLETSGLLRREHRQRLDHAYRLYRDRRQGPRSAAAERFAKRYSVVVPIHLLGVWDTVGSLGIPLNSFGAFNRRHFEFHDTRLSHRVRHACQALAVDEHRKAFAPTLWSPASPAAGSLEQAWFPGAHSNVGGGYPSRILSDVSLAWMMERAERHGLVLAADKRPVLLATHRSADIVDSYREFLSHFYRLVSPRRYLRPIGFTPFGNETLHPSVRQRRLILRDYRPINPTHPSLDA
ncbi:DUF2235 domain-containing protein [Halomonas sp. V046]|uniref:DUF2235 domain-containing protein n=1 Tax=Halomonas sp. V046 TaxID=3459611 RepID=UPI004044DF33